MKIEIVSKDVTSRDITTKQGKQLTFREQRALVSLPNGETRQISITLDDKAPAFPPGHFAVADGSFYVDRYGVLSLARKLVLLPS